MKEQIDVPILKAANYKLFDLLECVYSNPFNREGMKDAILKLYPDKEEKSVVRGMAIPTLRRLSLIIGYDDSIRLSANGTLVIEASHQSISEGLRALRVILVEIDMAGPMFLQEIRKTNLVKRKIFEERMMLRIRAPNNNAARERIRDWIKYLLYCELLQERDGEIGLNIDVFNRTKKELDPIPKKKYFEKLFFGGYDKLVQRERKINLVNIEDLRTEVAKRAYKEYAILITGSVFDKLLQEMPLITRNYTISFGRSMGAEEKLFKLKDKYYQTVSVYSNRSTGEMR